MSIKLDISKSLVVERHIKQTRSALLPYMQEISAEISSKELGSPESFAELQQQADYLKQIRKQVDKIKKQGVDLVLVLGIGGSNLGTWAIYDAIPAGIPMLFADTVDPDKMTDLVVELVKAYDEGKKVAIVVVSKSGKTTETLANYGALYDIIQENDAEHKLRTIYISDKDSPMADVAYEHGIAFAEVPKQIGGRFSVMTAVGLIPLMLANIDVHLLLEGVGDATIDCVQDDLEVNLAVKSAAVLYDKYEEGYLLHNNFIFSDTLTKVGYWYRQLMAESLGKECKGIFPLVSVGTTDLHSVMQFFADGSEKVMTTFISVGSFSTSLEITREAPTAKLVENFEGKTLNEIMEATLQGVKQSYEDMYLPYLSLEVETINAYNLGYLLQMKMFEVAYLGKLMGINTFNQPGVEDYKQKTREILAKN